MHISHVRGTQCHAPFVKVSDDVITSLHCSRERYTGAINSVLWHTPSYYEKSLSFLSIVYIGLHIGIGLHSFAFVGMHVTVL